MKLQKNLLWIPIFFSFVWGLFGLFAPSAVFRFLGVSAANVNVTLVSTQMTLGISQISLGIIAFWMRGLKDRAAMSGAMTIVGIIFLLFGLEGILVNFIVEGHAINMVLFIEAIVFILLGLLFFWARKPKEA